MRVKAKNNFLDKDYEHNVFFEVVGQLKRLGYTLTFIYRYMFTKRYPIRMGNPICKCVSQSLRLATTSENRYSYRSPKKKFLSFFSAGQFQVYSSLTINVILPEPLASQESINYETKFYKQDSPKPQLNYKLPYVSNQSCWYILRLGNDHWFSAEKS